MLDFNIDAFRELDCEEGDYQPGMYTEGVGDVVYLRGSPQSFGVIVGYTRFINKEMAFAHLNQVHSYGNREKGVTRSESPSYSRLRSVQYNAQVFSKISEKPVNGWSHACKYWKDLSSYISPVKDLSSYIWPAGGEIVVVRHPIKKRGKDRSVFRCHHEEHIVGFAREKYWTDRERDLIQRRWRRALAL